MITFRPRRDWCHGESTPGNWHQTHGNNLNCKALATRCIGGKSLLVQIQSQLLSQWLWWATCSTDWAVNPPYTTVSVPKAIVTYVGFRILWVNWSISHQYETKCGRFCSKENLGNPKASQRKPMTCHVRKLTYWKNPCALILHTSLVSPMT